MYVCVYIERERDALTSVCMYPYIHTYICMYMHTDICMSCACVFIARERFEGEGEREREREREGGREGER